MATEKPTVIVLGASGMLGSMVTDVLSRDDDLNIIATVRNQALANVCKKRVSQVEWHIFDSDTQDNTLRQFRDLGQAQWVINAIGLTKPYTHDDNPSEIQRAIIGNSLLPYWIASAIGETGGKVLQIATDCVYSGTKGCYVESDKHDAIDVYGKTKSLGESLFPNLHCLRCSIIGPEPKAYAFLIEWFRRQPQNTSVSGFTNHAWNGVTTLHFAKVCYAIIKNTLTLPHLQHIIPIGQISKYELLRSFSKAYHRADIVIKPTEASYTVDRTLATENPELNREIWKLAGYPHRPPTIPEMVEELAAFDFRFEGLTL